ncbi:Glycolipid 2-alpha-mannosyltransferase [Termitomyces sp. T112]|nr:Glycolipid 2-alpha-mannosyltransferase [Termitomyces sp. T112]
MRYVLLVLAVIVSLHYMLSFSNEKYGNATSFSNIKEKITGSSGKPPYMEPVPEEYYIKTNKTEPPARRANAVFVILARNSDLNGVVSSVKQMEDRFNKKFQYPYVFLNENPFEESFKKRVSKLTDAKVEFGLIPREHWFQPDSIDEVRASAAREDMAKNNVIYGGSVPYRNMCRFNSGFFYKHELLKPYKYYWRVEPDVKFFCDLDYDPFLLMQDQNKVYGFTVSLYEYEATIPTLWDATKEFMDKNAELIPTGNAMSFLSDDGGMTYNRCHFWSNFEIADLDLWRSEAYNKYFDFLDERGGFYYERWGDAPVHSIGAALFSKKEQIHFFNDIGYRHEPFQHCPQGEAHTRGKCWCDESQNFDYEWYSCLKRYDAMFA